VFTWQLGLFETLKADLAKGEMDRMLPPNRFTKGKPAPGFKVLSDVLRDVKSKQALVKNGHETQLVLNADRRQSRVTIEGPFNRQRQQQVPQGPSSGPSSGPPPPQLQMTSTEQRAAEVTSALSDVAKLAGRIAEVLSERLASPDEEHRYILSMKRCLDLRKMAFDPGYVAVEKAKYPLQKLYNWLESRLEGGGDANSDPILAEYAMPTFDVVWSQFLQLAERLRVAAARQQRHSVLGTDGKVPVAL
jgi:hypothetical protein